MKSLIIIVSSLITLSVLAAAGEKDNNTYFLCDSVSNPMDKEIAHHITVGEVFIQDGESIRMINLHLKNRKKHCLKKETQQSFKVVLDAEKISDSSPYNFITENRVAKQKSIVTISSMEMYDGDDMLLVYTPVSCASNDPNQEDPYQQDNCRGIRVSEFKCLQVDEGKDIPYCK